MRAALYDLSKAADRLLLTAEVAEADRGDAGRRSRARKTEAADRLGGARRDRFEAHHVSHYFVKRRASCSKFWQKTTYATFPKSGRAVRRREPFDSGGRAAQGTGPDITHFRKVLDDALSRQPITTLVADAGYDAEHVHEYAREERGVNTFIPPLIGRRTDKPPSGFWRRRMKSRLHLTRYSQRWQVETVNSMLKRLLGSALRARSYHSQCENSRSRAIKLNVPDHPAQRGFLRSRSGLICKLMRAVKLRYAAGGPDNLLSGFVVRRTRGRN